MVVIVGVIGDDKGGDTFKEFDGGFEVSDDLAGLEVVMPRGVAEGNRGDGLSVVETTGC